MMGKLAAALVLLATLAAAPVEARWRPSPAEQFDWQFTQPMDLASARGTINLDAFDMSAGTIANLRRRGVKAICYVNVGAWENWRPDLHLFPANVLGKNYVGWEGERWLDIRRLDVLLPIMRMRFTICRDKGFLAIEPDNLDGYLNDTGFPISKQDQLAYNKAIAAEAHRLGLSIGLKNAPMLIPDLHRIYDFAIAEDCFVWKWCDKLRPFVAAGKAVVAIEYPENGRNPLTRCADARRLGLQLVVKKRKLDAWVRRCR